MAEQCPNCEGDPHKIDRWTCHVCNGSGRLDGKALEAAAKAGHDTYERLAPDYGYETRPESRIKWDDLPQAHRNLMVVAYTAGVDAYLAALQEDTDG